MSDDLVSSSRHKYSRVTQCSTRDRPLGLGTGIVNKTYRELSHNKKKQVHGRRIDREH